jgi:hypothetical protein
MKGRTPLGKLGRPMWAFAATALVLTAPDGLIASAPKVLIDAPEDQP